MVRLFGYFMVALVAMTTMSVSSAEAAKRTSTRGCEQEARTFCLTAPSTLLHKYDFQGGATLYLIRTTAGNFYVYEGGLANVDSEHKVNLVRFPSARNKAVYTTFYNEGSHQAYIRRGEKGDWLELHVWAEDKEAKPEDLEFFLSNMRLF